MIARHRFLLCALVLAAHLTGCRTARPALDERPNASLIAPPPRLDSTARPAPAERPGILSGIGRIFSTPAGTANRQAVRLARATGPRKLAKGAVYAPQAKQVVAAYKPSAAVVLADSGATVTAIGKAKAPLAVGPGATATQTNPTTGLSWWLLLIPAGYVAWRVYRSTIPFA